MNDKALVVLSGGQDSPTCLYCAIEIASFTGVAQTGYSGYPDCREETMSSLQTAIQRGMGTEIQIHTPLMHLSKKETVELAQLSGDELKLVYPQTEEDAQPSRFEHLSFEHFFLQPLDSPERDENTQRAIAFCKRNPRWKLGLQTHKYLGLD